MKLDHSDIPGWRTDSQELAPGGPSPRGDVQVLRQAIMQDVREEIEKILSDARSRAEDIRAQAQAQANAERDAILQRARREAQDLRDQAVARAQMEAQTLKLRRREKLLGRCFAEARRQLASVTEWPDYAEVARQLVRDAVSHLNADNALVRADAETQKVLDANALAALSRELGVYLRPGEPLDRGTGVVVETPDGHRRYDNTLETRLARMQDVLRTPVYHVLMGEKL